MRVERYHARVGELEENTWSEAWMGTGGAA
jgi:hypothetical protein